MLISWKLVRLRVKCTKIFNRKFIWTQKKIWTLKLSVRKSKIWNEMLLKNPNRVRPEQVRRVKNPNRVCPERVQRGRLRRVNKILETRGNFDEVSEIKKSTIFFETSRQKILPKWKIWTNPINAKKFAHMLWNRKPYVLIDVEKILIGRVRSRPDRVRRGRLLWTPCKCTKNFFIVSNAQKFFTMLSSLKIMWRKMKQKKTTKKF